MVCNVYFIEWEFCRIIPLSADRGISVGALYVGALQDNAIGLPLLTISCCWSTVVGSIQVKSRFVTHVRREVPILFYGMWCSVIY